MNKREIKVCKKCGHDFLITIQEEGFYKRLLLPFPDNCPECRRNRRRDIRNKRALYKQKCDKCNVDLVSTYSQESELIVYCEKCYFDNIASIEKAF